MAGTPESDALLPMSHLLDICLWNSRGSQVLALPNGFCMFRITAYYLACTLNRFTGNPSEHQSRYSEFSRAPKRRSRSGAIGSPTYQEYEPRRLLAGVTFTPATGEILIGGTTGVDVAQVSQVNEVITVTHEGFDTRTFSASEVNSILFVGLAGDDFFENQTAISARAFGQAGNDTLIGGSGNDRLSGNTGDDIIRGNGGDDFIAAGNGDDNVDAGAGNDRVLGIMGFNVLEGGAGDDSIFGGNDIDVITDVSGTNLLVGNGGDDSIQGGTGMDQIFGGPGADTIFGQGGNDRIYAQGGDDFVSGGSGDDIIGGNDGDDVLRGEQGNDRVVGGNGNDTANFSGELLSYEVTGVNTALTINDLRGPNFGLEDLALNVEQFSFGDGTRSASETLNPVVNPPGANVREVVFVQPIVASNSDGSNQAEFFGTAAQEADIKNRIDEIFGQANIDIEFLPTRQINDTFTNVGTGTGTRASGDLDRIISNGDSSGIGSPNRNVIDLYFVERVPSFDDVGDGTANGLAFVGSPGTAIHVGDNLTDFSPGRQTIAEVTAHEIGHNLGLSHVNTSGNLLAANGSGSDLTSSQINTILRSSLSQPTTTSGTLVQVDLPGEGFNQGAATSANPQADSSTLSIGGCGGCGVCGPCTGGITLS